MYATSTHVPNGHNPAHCHPQPPLQSNHHPQRNPQPPTPKQPINVVGIPSVSIQNNQLVVGSSQSSSTRSYTSLKVLGDGSFGTVWLCDWHGTLPPDTPLSPMQGARPEWVGKRLVAVKRMKKKWEGGWDECQKLKELESLRAIPFHPNIIPLYDFFLLPDSKELYFVFESMEGNLYHLIKARKGRALAGGLVSSIFCQIVSGLNHIHDKGYFHRDMKPENVLVTTTGHFEYTSVSPIAPPNAPKELDVVAIIKLADFGLARETKSKPPYTEYVSTRWYRAPEVLLMSRDYSNPVDMWAFGTIMAELVNLRPLFPGSDQIDQLARICEILGDPSDEYGLDLHKRPVGGGPWLRGVKMAKAFGSQFPKIQPKDIYSLFDRTVPLSLIHCISDLLKYDPDARLTSRQCLDHPYLLETTPRNNLPNPCGPPPTSNPSFSLQHHNGISSHTPRTLPSQHNTVHVDHLRPSQVPDAVSYYRSSHYSSTLTPSPHASGIIQEERRTQPPVPSWPDSNGRHISSSHHKADDSMEVLEDYANSQAMDTHSSSMVSEYSVRPHIEHNSIPPQNKLGKLNPLSFGKKHSKWGLGMFGGDKSHHQGLPPLDENPVPSSSTPSLNLKRTKSSSTDSKSLPEVSPMQESPVRMVGDLKKSNRKEAERLQREAEKQRRKLAEKTQREQARAVMRKRDQMMQKTVGSDIEWLGGSEQRLEFSEPKGKQAASGPIRQNQTPSVNVIGSTTVNAAAGRFATQAEPSIGGDWRGVNERVAKARRREFDDDHSMSSSDVHSIGRMSSISFATVDSDPGPSRIRNRPSLFGLNRMTSMSSLRTFEEFPTSARSSNSFSLEGQLAQDFRSQVSMNSSHLAGSVSPPPMHMLSLSPSVSPSLSPSPTWIQVQQHKESLSARREQSPPYITTPPPHPSQMGFDFNGQLHGHPPSSYGHPPGSYGHPPSSYGHHPPSSGLAPKSAINPIFKVPPLPPQTGDSFSSRTSLSLPPFSHLEAIAGGEYPQLSPMSFTVPSEES